MLTLGLAPQCRPAPAPLCLALTLPLYLGLLSPSCPGLALRLGLVPVLWSGPVPRSCSGPVPYALLWPCLWGFDMILPLVVSSGHGPWALLWIALPWPSPCPCVLVWPCPKMLQRPCLSVLPHACLTCPSTIHVLLPVKYALVHTLGCAATSSSTRHSSCMSKQRLRCRELLSTLVCDGASLLSMWLRVLSLSSVTLQGCL